MIKLCFQASFGFFYTSHGVCVQASIQQNWDRSLSLIIKDYEAISNFFYFGSNKFKAKWWTHVSYGLMPNIAECICKKVGKKRLYTLSYCIVERNRLGSHLLIQCRTHTFGFVESPTLSLFFDSDAEIQTIFYYFTEVYRPNTFAGSLRYLIILLFFLQVHSVLLY